jgi:hypothetical protein
MRNAKFIQFEILTLGKRMVEDDDAVVRNWEEIGVER